MFFSCLLKGYGPNLQNDTKLETTSCFIVKNMALDEPLFCTGSLWEAFQWCEFSNILTLFPYILHKIYRTRFGGFHKLVTMEPEI